MLFRFGIKLDLYRQLHLRHQVLVIEFDRTRISVIPASIRMPLYSFRLRLMLKIGSIATENDK